MGSKPCPTTTRCGRNQANCYRSQRRVSVRRWTKRDRGDSSAFRTTGFEKVEMMTWLADLFDAIRQRDLTTIKQLIDEDRTRLRYSASYCPSLLWNASESSSVEVVRYFLEDMGLDPEVCSADFGN